MNDVFRIARFNSLKKSLIMGRRSVHLSRAAHCFLFLTRVHSFANMMSRSLKSLSKIELKNFVDSVDVILSDCDGVLWEETKVIRGSPEAVGKLKQEGKKFFYVTNNNGKSRLEVLKKCKGFGYNPTVEEIVCTSYVAAMYLKDRNFTKKVYLVGNTGLTQELENVGIAYIGLGPDKMEGNELSLVENFKPDPEVGAVIIGFDTDFSYPKLLKAATYAADPNVIFIGTNPDTDRPSPNSNKFPGTGCFIQAVEAAAGRKAVIVGKPDPYISQHVIKTYALDPARTLMIGDNCNTDILLGKRCGFKTLLVLTGVTTEANIIALSETTKPEDRNIIPDYYTDQLSDIVQLLDN